MKITFLIDFFTHFGQQMYICGNIRQLGSWDPNKALCLHFQNGKCVGEITLPKSTQTTIKYRYFLKIKDNIIEKEWGTNRTLVVENDLPVVIKDQWRSIYHSSNVFSTSIFVNVFNRRISNEYSANPPINTQNPQLKFKFNAPLVSRQNHIGILGNQLAFGNWDPERVVLLSDRNFPIWEATFAMEELSFPLEYKYVVVDSESKKLLFWENGKNRRIDNTNNTFNDTATLIQNDEYIGFPIPDWKSAGVSIPVFSLRTKHSFGIGDFLDLKLLAKWANKTRLKLIQILPINDTTETYTWKDSYPYAAISVFALHPIYINLEKFLTLLSPKDKALYHKQKDELNRLEKVDYEKTLIYKLDFTKKIFKKIKREVLAEAGFKEFLAQNKSWLSSYAAFCVLRDTYKTTLFKDWGKYGEYQEAEVKKLTHKNSPHYEEVLFHYFVQYELHLQLKEAIDYAHSLDVAIKGDLPIGICKASVEAWKDTALFNMDMQAGAPPDDFAKIGQNWGMPTYKWEEMKKDNYLWWRNRFKNMAKYFDAYRIDHILGFFRIWQILLDHCWGILGHFNPALLYTPDELHHNGLWFDYDRMCRPYIREHFLYSLFKEQTEKVKKQYLKSKGNGVFELSEKVNTQKKIETFFEENTLKSEAQNRIRQGLLQLCTEVLFIPVKEGNTLKYHPRISLHETHSYKDLDPHTKDTLNHIYTNFYYYRQNEFWRQRAMEKLPTLIQSTNMLVCGEDLGMIPSCVPQVMQELNILSLEIQRMPKSTDREFAHPADAPYFSVCTTSTHDMSTIRMWWEEDRAKSQRFYNHILGEEGSIPYYAEDWLCRKIIIQHLYSPAMWVIFPLQDILAMDKRIRWDKTNEERINVPNNPTHYWQFRMHITIEELLAEDDFSAMLRKMLAEAVRS